LPGRLKIEGRASSGDGQVSITGYTQIAGEGELSAELRVDGDDFQITRLPNWQVSASPSVLVEISPDLTKVTGGIAIPHANLVFSSLPESANVPSNDAVVHGRDDPAGNGGPGRSIDLQATLGDDVKLSGFGLTTGVSGGVRLQGATRSPLIGAGRLDLYDGRYKAYGQELEIERGSLTFNGPLENPVLDVRAVRQIKEVVAGISLAGTPRSPQSSVFSEPAMSDAEILSYLITGRPLNSASAGEGEVLGQAAFALGLTGAGLIATQIGNTLGLDTLTVDGNADTGRIVAGKRLGNRLSAEYGYGLVDKLGTLLLRYELNDRVIIESSTGSTSALDVVYSIKKE
jgi:translocation and assembly module TamB